ncbi:tyrosine-type recombinase/integrase [Bifidobacterium castoris]|uniref:Integrase n=1 Tax=Bifidobacterium castoris TaxID=2306972 RepID=A0A430F4G4_9BIFI|nr:tyrosine-type recombinase/integrase [Bifidobacterium castoris]RSX44644.1 integrase [Bifidobacterium castoris]
MPRKRATGAARPYPYRQKRKDGTYVERWKVELTLGKGPDGGYRTKQITASTFRECQRKYKEALERLNRTGTVETPDDAPLTDYVDKVLESAHHRVSPGTMKNYRAGAKEIRRAFDGVRVRDVRASMLRSFLDDLSSRSASMTAKARTLLNQAFDMAVGDQVIQSNPLASVKRPSNHAQTDRRAFSVPELQLMLRNAATMPLPVAARLWWRMLTGMRQGEILGVVLEDLHLDAPCPFYSLRWSMTSIPRRHGCDRLPDGTWSCGRQVGAFCPQAYYDVPDRFRMRVLHGGLCLKSPKSGRSRTVPLMPQLVQVVHAYLAYTADWPNPHGLLWRHEDGTPIDDEEDLDDFKRLLVMCGMDPKERRGHETRYSAVTLLRRAGVDTKTVLEIVGHTTMQVDDIYRTVDMEEKAEAMNELGESLQLPKGLLPGGEG